MGVLKNNEDMLMHILGEIQHGEEDDNLDGIEELASLILQAVKERKEEIL